jgi:hypothetical protein
LPALALSQVAPRPSVKSWFDLTQDQPQVAQLLRAGCAQERRKLIDRTHPPVMI